MAAPVHRSRAYAHKFTLWVLQSGKIRVVGCTRRRLGAQKSNGETQTGRKKKRFKKLRGKMVYPGLPFVCPLQLGAPSMTHTAVLALPDHGRLEKDCVRPVSALAIATVCEKARRAWIEILTKTQTSRNVSLDVAERPSLRRRRAAPRGFPCLVGPPLP